MKPEKWTQDEVGILRRMANGKYTAAEIAEMLPKRSVKAVRAKARSLRLSNYILPAKEKKGIKPEAKTPTEIERSMYAKKALELFAQKYPTGTPHDNVRKHGTEALMYWLECVERSHTPRSKKEAS